MDIGQWVHFGVAGVIECFKWIYENKPNSIFEEPMLAKIKEWHLKYNLSCGLYIYEESDDFNLEQLQGIYWQEFIKESSWLKMSWYGVSLEKNVGTESEDTLSSLKRVYRLISKKTGKTSWGIFAKLSAPFVSDELIDSLREYGIRIILVEDIKQCNNQLKENEKKAFQKEHFLTSDLINYCQSDLCFDQIAGGVSADELLCFTEQILNEYMEKSYIDVFFHEQNFRKIISGIDEYWEHFREIKAPLIINKGILVEDRIYFTTCNAVGLYAFDIETEKTEYLIDLPGYRRDSYSSLICHGGNIWIVPVYGENILVFHVKSRKIIAYSLSFLKEKGTDLKYDGYFADGKFLWVYPHIPSCIVRINMEERAVEIFSEWPSDITDSCVLFSDISTRKKEVIVDNEQKWIFSYSENILIQSDKDIKLKKRIKLLEEVYKIHKWHTGTQKNCVNGNYTIDNYIYDICSNIQTQWIEIKNNIDETKPKSIEKSTIGKKIYSALL